MSDIGVNVDARSIREAMRDAGFSHFWIHFRTNHRSLDDLGRALGVANDPDGTFGARGWRVPTGIVFEVEPGTTENFEEWLSRLVTNLESLGATGILEGTNPTYIADWPTEDPTPAAFLAWAEDLEGVTTDQDRTAHWHVPTDATQAIVDHAASWTEAGGEELIINWGGFSLAMPPETDVASMMRSSLVQNHHTASIRYQPKQQRGRMAFLSPGGEAVMQEIGARLPWRQRLEAVQDAFNTLTPQYLDLAFIRSAPSYTRWWTQVDIRQKRDPRQELPDLHESDIRYNRHLLSRYTPDAHGIQILTDQHLARARDLSSWRIRELGHGRHLVQASDLTSWYSTPLPDQDVVDQAREDFGDMILTKEVLAANPPPWKRDRMI